MPWRRPRDVSYRASQFRPRMSTTAPQERKGRFLNIDQIAAAKAAANARERDIPAQLGAAMPVEKWRPQPNLLTRREIQSIIAEQLG